MTNIIAAAYDWIFSAGWTIVSKWNNRKVDVYRKTIWPDIQGKVLELGPGYAKSLRHLAHMTATDGAYVVDPGVVHSYTALEPNPYMFGGLHKNAEENGFRVAYDDATTAGHQSTAAAAPRDNAPQFTIVRGALDDPNCIPQAILDEAPYDTILTSFSLCTARDPKATVDNIIRLLRPGGAHVFIEHVRQPPPGDERVIEDNNVNAVLWGKIQDWLTPAWSFIGHGCHLNRCTGETIASAKGWERVEYKSVRPVVDPMSFVMPMSFGKAIKAQATTP